jgi:HAD superfamily hydrolase (TIGR01484 family)
MQPLAQADLSTFRTVRFVLTDMDETLTYQGRLAARTYDALERLQQAGVTVIPVTAAPAGWCDQMALMWPVDGVIGENGGLYFQRNPGGHGLTRTYWHSADARASVTACLAEIGRRVVATVPSAVFADDQPFRLTSLGFAQPADPAQSAAIIAALKQEGADVTVNNLWILGWLGGYDKLGMARRVLRESYGVAIETDADAVLYVGDSANDAPMFGYFRHTVGVSTVTRYLSEIPTPPNWIAAGPGGVGFVEAADAVIAARQAR